MKDRTLTSPKKLTGNLKLTRSSGVGWSARDIAASYLQSARVIDPKPRSRAWSVVLLQELKVVYFLDFVSSLGQV